jgi:exodeoxyribonuclease VII small subunit
MKGQGKRLILGCGRGERRAIVPGGGRRGLPPRIWFLCPRKPMPKAVPPIPETYEAALEELEQLIGRIESGQLPLEQLLQGYERGAQLLAFCRSKLEAVETQIKVLDEGALKPWKQE